MIRKLLATTAMVALMSGGVYAADNATQADTNATNNSMIFSVEPGNPMESQNGYYLRSNIINFILNGLYLITVQRLFHLFRYEV